MIMLLPTLLIIQLLLWTTICAEFVIPLTRVTLPWTFSKFALHNENGFLFETFKTVSKFTCMFLKSCFPSLNNISRAKA